jgi:hypothetical protein
MAVGHRANVMSGDLPSENVAGTHDPDADGIEEDSRSPAERAGDELSEWLRDRHRRQRWRVEPTEAALAAVVVAVASLVVAGGLGGWSYWSSSANGRDATYLVEVLTMWATLPVAAALLGAGLLAQYRSRRTCDELEKCLDGQESNDGDSGEDGIDIDIGPLTRLRRSLRWTRSATVLIAILGLVTAVAAMTNLIWVFSSSGVNSAANTPWYGYLGDVLARLAWAIPALTCVLIAPRGWARGSALLCDDDADLDETFGDEPAATR